MRKSIVIAAVLAVAGFSTQALAKGAAGCGVGSLIFKKNTVVSQTLAGTTNQYFGQAYSITTGTSGCKTSGFVQDSKESQYFAESNFSDLSVEMAKGEGENLNAFAEILGCEAADFGKMTRSKYESIFPSAKTTPAEMLENVQALGCSA